jgi:hypothetical protein
MVRINTTSNFVAALVVLLTTASVLWCVHSNGQEVAARSNARAPQDGLPTAPKDIIHVNYLSSFPAYPIAKNLKKDTLPEFFAFLADDSCDGAALGKTVSMIYQLNDKNDDKAIERLLAFVKRPVDWDRWRDSKVQTAQIPAVKWQALETIGFLGGDNAERILKSAMTLEGAKELSKAWLPGVNATVLKHQSVLDNMRGAAANGLAYSKNPETRKLVEAEYDKEKSRLATSGEPKGYYASQLVDAMVKMEMVKEIGLDAYAALYDGESDLRNAYRKYLPKYRIQ